MYWVVIWLSGEAAMVMPGSEKYYFEDPAVCEEIRAAIDQDIRDGVVEIDGDLYVVNPDGENLEWQEWEVTCETEHYNIGDQKNG